MTEEHDEKIEGPNRIYYGDSLKLMLTISSRSIDAVVTDPPYCLTEDGGMERFKNGKPIQDRWDWDCFSDVAGDHFADQYLKQIARVLKKGRWAYVWCGDLMPGILWRLGQPYGLKAKCVIIAKKRNAAPSWRKQNWRIQYETCIAFTMGPAKKGVLNWLGHKFMEAFAEYDISDDGRLIEIDFPMGTKTTAHPTEKPEQVIVPLILASSDPGDVILDPFSGSGTVPAVAKRLGRQYIGIDFTPEWVKASRDRLAQGCLFHSPIIDKFGNDVKAFNKKDKARKIEAATGTPLFENLPPEEKTDGVEEADIGKEDSCSTTGSDEGVPGDSGSDPFVPTGAS